MPKFQCHYEVLKVTRDAPAEVIRAAYRSLSQKHHPDKNVGNPEAARVMARLNAAYSVLSDAEQRELYDYQILHGRGTDQYEYQESANAGDFNGEPGRASEAGAGSAGKARDSRLNRVRDYVAGRHGRIAAVLLGSTALVLVIVGRSSWQEQRSMRLLEQAANYTPGAASAPPAASAPATSASADMELVGKANGTGRGQDAPAPRASKDEPAAATTAAKAEAPAAAPKASDFERLTAMLKSMGLGLHKLDLPSKETKPKEAAPKAAEAEKAVAASKAVPAAATKPVPAATAAAQPSRAAAVEAAQAERVATADAVRADAKPQAEPSRASAVASASANAVASAPRQAPVADMRTCAPPSYPPKAHAAGETGTVQVALLVAGDGRVIESKVQKSSGSAELDKAARKAFSQCRFKVSADDKDADPVWARLEYVFSLD
ncbi:TonB family protein [Pseudoduganella armeniaca]|uniref:Molecular chaperone DnaJ n=1 Tax=Pseudoduganella armeniaca TaxID=2072590 RepID=A0A2R4C7T9_9BURK|nr:TonB family protein [Pseudoduganella armeniaca]AVR95655.1 molecular chaperone DnaJ [Pseudoduganella armeniaca]